ncbi:hypothetical protein QYE76_013763 [Lolium multiflorum]|uniref:Phosphotransferase n=1 Tax=Lolium multiflorum TaxID=4521 RepID=A0AAD8X574_LOLMU|nr:hypothetical protein QYE76_013763 [Lolium multiflorum]
MGRAGWLRVAAAAGCAALTCAFATALVARRVAAWRRWRRALAVVRDFEESFATPAERLQRVVNSLAIEMFAGLASEDASKVRMLLTCVDSLPDGYNTDADLPIPLLFFFHASLLNFMISNQFAQCGHANLLLFANFLAFLGSNGASLILLLLFFYLSGLFWVGKDVAQCLNEALVRNGLNLQVNALMNNTVGTLALGHYYDEDTVAAVIIGAGTNACYIENNEAITKRQGLLTTSGQTVVNVEWGSFRPPQIPLTPYDICFNNETQNYYDQGFEKMISGVYLGEIARLVFHKMAQESDVFGTAIDGLATPFILSTPCLAAIREDDSLDLREVGRRMEEHLKIPNVPLKTRRLVQRVCDVVTQRAARLAAAGIVAVLQKIGRDGTRCGTTQVRRMTGVPKRSVIAIEGGLYQGYSVFREYLNEAVVEILGEEIAPTVVLRVVEEGSGIGAALLAAAYSSNRQESI